MTRLAFSVIAALGFASCSPFGGGLPDEPPPLRDMREPLALKAPPADEAARRQLPAGCFSGVYVEEARSSLQGLLGEPEGLRVARVVENSPGQAAGIEAGDVLLSAAVGSAEPRPLHWSSEWRQLELEQPPGTELRLVFDRAGEDMERAITLVPRVAPAARATTHRLREEQRVGIVVRTATEVEARAAGLAPGAGAVVIGLADTSPWRAAGVTFGDLVVAVDGRPLADPEMLMTAIRAAPEGGTLALELWRDGHRRRVEAALSERSQRLAGLSIPLLFHYGAERDQTEWSVLFGLVGYESTAAAWEFRLLWLLTFSGSQADRLAEVDE